MDKDGKFYATIAVIAVLFVAGLVLILALDLRHKREAVAAMVKTGVDPIKARCAIDGPNPENAVICNGLAK